MLSVPLSHTALHAPEVSGGEECLHLLTNQA